MAGIGFKLQKLFREDTLSSRIKAYSYAGLITSGPWILTVFTMAFLQGFLHFIEIGSKESNELFIVSVSYCFLFSNLLFGSYHLVVSRYVSDLLYEQKNEQVYAVFLGLSKLVAGLSLCIWVVFSLCSSLPLLYEALFFILFLVVNLIWVLNLFLTAASSYRSIVYSFLAGGAVSVTMAKILLMMLPVSTLAYDSAAFFLLLSMTSGLVITLFGLYFALLISFPRRNTEGQFRFLTYYDRFPALLLSGVCYAIGSWVCNWVIWYGEGARQVAGTFLYHPEYDTAVFWSYLSVIPAMILFVVSIETRFYERYQIFYKHVNFDGSLDQIQQAKHVMKRYLDQELHRVMRKQGMFTLIALCMTQILGKEVFLNPDLTEIFPFTLIGAFGSVMTLIIALLLLYFDDRRGTLYTMACFAFSNCLLSVALLPFGYEMYGLAYAIGSALTFAFAWARLNWFIKDIDFYAFCANRVQPLKFQPFTRLGVFFEKKFSE